MAWARHAHALALLLGLLTWHDVNLRRDVSDSMVAARSRGTGSGTSSEENTLISACRYTGVTSYPPFTKLRLLSGD